MRTLKTMKRFAKVAAGRSLHLINDHRVLYRHAKGTYGEGRAIWAEGRRFIGQEKDTFSTYDFAREQLEATVGALQSSKVAWFVVPSATSRGYTVGVYEKDRKKVIKSLETLAKSHHYITVPSRKRTSQEKRALHASRAFSKSRLRNASILRVSSFVIAPNGSLYGGFEFGCDIVFWVEGMKKTRIEDLPSTMKVSVLDGYSLDGALIASHGNRMGDIIPAANRDMVEIKIGNKKYKTFKVFDKHFVGDVQFPIDVVYTWVDGDDPEWIKKYNKYSHIAKDNPHNNTSSRFISRNELKYSLRSLAMYGGFIRNIYIVTDGQVPLWLNEKADGIKVVSHQEIFSDPSALPVFNSHAIESQLHHIEGLSEHYLYFNDDVFLGCHLAPDAFFHANGIAKISQSPAQYGIGEPSIYESAPSSAGKNVRALLERQYGETITQKYKHTPHPQLKSVAFENEARYKDVFDETMRSRFRAITDIPFAGTMMESTLLLEGKGIPINKRAGVVDIASPDLSKDLATIKSRRPQTFCLNDANTPVDDISVINKKVIAFMEDMLPFKSPWEL